MKKWIAGTITALMILGCADGGSTQNVGSHYNYTFAVDTQGWLGGFSDYQQGDEAIYGFQFAHTTLPAPLDESDGAVRISANNENADLFMYMKTKLTALDINTTYKIDFTVEFASNMPNETNTTEVSPGQLTSLKVGAIGYEPLAKVDENGYMRMNIDKGEQYGSGSQMVRIGNLTNGTSEELYHLKTLSSDTPLIARTDENGTLWLIVGTDSGYDGTLTVYYNTVNIDMEKISE